MTEKVKTSSLAFPIIKESEFKRSAEITKITPHIAKEVNDARTLCERNKSNPFHYYIGVEGDIVAGLEEDGLSRVSNNDNNDNTAITILLANSDKNNYWPVSEATIESLINLCEDICRRYDIDLLYTGDTTGTLTCHDIFIKTADPGYFLKGRLREIGFIVYNRIHGLPSEPQKEKGIFRVRKYRDDKSTQKGVYRSRNEAIRAANKYHLNVYDANGIEVYNYKFSSTETVWDNLEPIQIGDVVTSKNVLCYACPGSRLCSMKIEGVWKTYIPALGGYIPNQYISMVNPNDDYVSGKTQFTLDEGIVEDVDEKAERVKVHGIWVHRRPLLKKRN